MNDVIYQYDGSLDGFLCCVYESYVYKEAPAAFCCDEDPLSLYEVRTVITQPAYSQRVSRGIAARSGKALAVVRRGFLTCLPDKELHLYAFIRKLLAEGPGFMRDLSDPACYPLYRAIRHMNGELEKLRGFVRFSNYGGTLGAEIEPKNRVLPMLRRHFCERYHSEVFFLYDRTHREALLYSGGVSRIVPLERFEMAQPDEEEAGYRRLWRRFYDTIAIEARKNEKLRMTHMPKRYWATMTEFQDESFFKARPKVPAAASRSPGAPGAIPAPATPPEGAPPAPASAP